MRRDEFQLGIHRRRGIVLALTIFHHSFTVFRPVLRGPGRRQPASAGPDVPLVVRARSYFNLFAGVRVPFPAMDDTFPVDKQRRRSDCNHYLGHLHPDVPAALVGGRAPGAIIMKSEVDTLIQSCREYFDSHPTVHQWNKRFLLDDNADQLDALMVGFRFCPLCGEHLF
jgi:hypothetical protein